LENLGHYGICSLEDDAPIKKEIPSHHVWLETGVSCKASPGKMMIIEKSNLT
jgi:hypothetical protein